MASTARSSQAALRIGAPLEAAPAGLPAVVVDPGRAFPMRAHPATRAWVELLARGERRGRVLDACCGSGVAAVVAARLGYGPVVAVDLDEVAVEVARGTCCASGVVADVRRADVLVDELPHADLVVANIELRVVERRLACTRSPCAITSGDPGGGAPPRPAGPAMSGLELHAWAADSWLRS